MVTLLHIDSSVRPGEASASRSVAAAFRRAWEEQHPEGTVIYHDLAAEPAPTSPPTPGPRATPRRPHPTAERVAPARVAPGAMDAA